MDLSSSYGAAVRTGLPHAVIVAERSHLVRLAGDTVTACRQRVIRETEAAAAARWTSCGGCAAGCSPPTNDSG
jgi:transposase